MKGEFIEGKIKEDSASALPKESTCGYPHEKRIIGDIDELIFPDDEPYYISER